MIDLELFSSIIQNKRGVFVFESNIDIPYTYMVKNKLENLSLKGVNLVKSFVKSPSDRFMDVYSKQNSCFCGRVRRKPWVDLVDIGLGTYGCTSCHQNTGVKSWGFGEVNVKNPIIGDFILAWDEDFSSTKGFFYQHKLETVIEMKFEDNYLNGINSLNIPFIENNTSGSSEILGWLTLLNDSVRINYSENQSIELPKPYQPYAKELIATAKRNDANIFAQILIKPLGINEMSFNVFFAPEFDNAFVEKRVQKSRKRLLSLDRDIDRILNG